MEQLLDLLRSIEWHQPMSNSAPSCPSCENYLDGYERTGHDKDCLLSFYIRELEQQLDIVDAVPWILQEEYLSTAPQGTWCREHKNYDLCPETCPRCGGYWHGNADCRYTGYYFG